jgi:hypothetical protein
MSIGKTKLEGKNLTSVFLLKFKFNSQMNSKLEVLSYTMHSDIQFFTLKFQVILLEKLRSVHENNNSDYFLKCILLINA